MERSYQRQKTIFQNHKSALVGGSKKGKEQRYVRNVGLGFKAPREVLYFELNIPFTIMHG